MLITSDGVLIRTRADEISTFGRQTQGVRIMKLANDVKLVSMAKTAREEGFDHIANLFEGVAAIEKEHEERYRKLLENIETGIVFSRDGDTIWKCKNCGHIHVGPKAPEVCPVCAHPQAYFEVKAENH